MEAASDRDHSRRPDRPPIPERDVAGVLRYGPNRAAVRRPDLVTWQQRVASARSPPSCSVRDVARRTSTPEYLPTDDDLALCQWSSRGIHVRDYVAGPAAKTWVRFVDVGGTDAEQRKWGGAFADVPFQMLAFVLPLDAAFKLGSDLQLIIFAISMRNLVIFFQNCSSSDQTSYWTNVVD